MEEQELSLRETKEDLIATMDLTATKEDLKTKDDLTKKLEKEVAFFKTIYSYLEGRWGLFLGVWWSN